MRFEFKPTNQRTAKSPQYFFDWTSLLVSIGHIRWSILPYPQHIHNKHSKSCDELKLSSGSPFGCRYAFYSLVGREMTRGRLTHYNSDMMGFGVAPKRNHIALLNGLIQAEFTHATGHILGIIDDNEVLCLIVTKRHLEM